MNAVQSRLDKPKASILASLTFSSSVRPKKGGQQDARTPTQVVSDALAQQLRIIEAEMTGAGPYTVKKTRFVKGEHGTTKKDVLVQPRSCYWKDASGKYFLNVPYGTKAIEFAPGQTAVVAGDDLASVRGTVGKLLEALKAGELDTVVAEAAGKAKETRRATRQ